MKTPLTIILAFIVSASVAQVKIGNITIDSATASKYFLDCYQHPDTLKDKSSLDFGACTNCSASIENWDRWENAAKNYNENLHRMAIGRVYRAVKYPAGNDTVFTNGIKGAYLLTSDEAKPLPYKGHENKYEIRPHEAWIYQEDLGWAVPRKPSEIDFIKWKVRTSK